ncbi:hypothetical protein LTR56_021983 [Elasticomyces elasticus]|nr:hypothetical protein LTR56_021983 [Elasticomyces elasticus]KAK3630229.1 hypothetical protein LTR22_021607 [Elasticomyces elasticus]KAK4920145.1 hypothetical protein LTR49_012244 [Elasticomyces elasticus]KAK5748960.1 hypothetical protein LTS12_020997 [Elasticomyces elasticus]
MATTEPTTTLEFRICGWLKGHEIILVNTRPGIADMIRQLEEHLGPDDYSKFTYRLAWHWGHEPCYVQRILYDMPSLVRKHHHASKGEYIRLHFYRSGERAAENAKEGTGAAEPSKNSKVAESGQKDASSPNGRSTNVNGEPNETNSRRQRAHSAAGRSTAAGSSLQQAASTAVQLTAPGEIGSEEQSIRTVVVRCSWSGKTLKLLRLKKLVMIDVSDVELGMSCRDLPAKISESLILVLRNAVDVNKVFQDVTDLRLQITVNVPGQIPIRLDDVAYGRRVLRISDLLGNPLCTGQRLNVTVELIANSEEVTHTSKSQRRGTSALPAIDLGKLLKPLPSDNDSRSDWIRVGDERKRKRSTDEHVYEEFPLMAHAIAKVQRHVEFLGTRAWDFDTMSIGGLELCKVQRDFKQSFEWFGAFEGVQQGSSVRKLMLEGEIGNPRVPVLPPLTFNDFDAHAYENPMRDAAIEKRGLSVVVRYVSHLKTQAASNLNFPDNHQIEATNSDDVDSISENIMKELNDDEETRALFKVALKGKWRLHLWVMVQAAEPHDRSVLFRFRRPTMLNSFVSSHALKASVPKLYMEAHLWPKNISEVPLTKQDRDLEAAKIEHSDGQELMKRLDRQTQGALRNHTWAMSSAAVVDTHLDTDGNEQSHELDDHEAAVADDLVDSDDDPDVQAGIQRSLKQHEDGPDLEHDEEPGLQRAIVASLDQARVGRAVEADRAIDARNVLTAEDMLESDDEPSGEPANDHSSPGDARDGPGEEHSVEREEHVTEHIDEVERQNQEIDEQGGSEAGTTADADKQHENGQSPSSAETYRRAKLSIPDHVPKHLRI